MAKALENMTLAELKKECTRRKLLAKNCRKNKADLLIYLKSNPSSERESPSKKSSGRESPKRESPKKYKNKYSKVELSGWNVPKLQTECGLKESQVYCKQLHKDELVSLLEYASVGQKFFNFLPTFDFSEKDLEKMQKKDLITLCRGSGESESKCNNMTKSQLIATRLLYQDIY